MKKLSEIKITGEMKEKISKCATAEEIAALAQEYDVELTKEEITAILKSNTPKELSDDDLDQIFGGEKGDDWGQHLPPEHRGQWIGKYAEGYVGKRVYCVYDNDSTQFCWGILQKSWEDDGVLWTTVRLHNILIEGWNHDTDKLPALADYSKTRIEACRREEVGQVLENIQGDATTLFLYV